MATIALTKDNYNQTLQDNQNVVIDFWASWCAPCMRFGPVYEQVSEKFDDVVFAKVDTDANQEIAAAMDIRSIPTVMFFRNGQLVGREGPLNGAQLEAAVEELKTLDIDAAPKA